MIELIDSHCHISKVPTAKGGYICNAVSESDWTKILDTAHSHKNVYPALGVHPWYVSECALDWDIRLQDLLIKFPWVIIGECGLDKLHADYDKQMSIFLRHIELADKLKRVINVHCVRAWNDMFVILQDAKNVPGIIMHGFSGSPEIVRQFLRLNNVYFSLGPSVLDERRCNLQKSLEQIPKNRILIESDLTMAESAHTLPRVATYIAEKTGVLLSDIYDNTLKCIGSFIQRI